MLGFQALGLVIVEISAEDKIEPGRPYVRDGITKMIPSRQTGWLWAGRRHPIEMKLDIDDKSGPRKPGLYLLGGECFKVAGNERGFTQIQFYAGKVDLIPAAEAIVALGGEVSKLKAA